jgi:hypothetical protein
MLDQIREGIQEVNKDLPALREMFHTASLERLSLDAAMNCEIEYAGANGRSILERAYEELWVVRANYDAHESIGEWSTEELVKPALTACERRFIEEVVRPLTPVLGAVRLREKARDLARCIEFLKEKKWLAITLSDERFDHPREWVACVECCRTLDQLWTGLEDQFQSEPSLGVTCLPVQLSKVLEAFETFRGPVSKALGTEPRAYERGEEEYRYWEDRAEDLGLPDVSSLPLPIGVLHPRFVWHRGGAFHRLWRIRRILRSALDYWTSCAEDREADILLGKNESEVARLALDFLQDDSIWVVLAKDFFQPDMWVAHSADAKAIMLRDPMRLNARERILLTEIYHSFVLGQWNSVAALSRALLERAIKSRAASIGISVNWIDGATSPGRTPRAKTLEALIDDVSKVLPKLASDMDRVRRAGNRVLHEGRQAPWNPEAADRQRKEFLAVLESLRICLEGLYE